MKHGEILRAQALCCFRKRFLTRPAAISARFWSRPLSIILWSVILAHTLRLVALAAGWLADGKVDSCAVAGAEEID